MEAMCNMNMKNTCPMMICPMMRMHPINLNNMMTVNPSYMNNFAGFNPMILRNSMISQYPTYNTNYISSPNLFYMEMKPVSIEDIED